MNPVPESYITLLDELEPGEREILCKQPDFGLLSVRLGITAYECHMEIQFFNI